MSEENLYSTADKLVPRAAKEQRLGQRGLVVWLYGISGSGKSSLAGALEHKLHAAGRQTVTLDGDNVRAGLNRGLGFSLEGRMENIRRAAEVARLFVETGTIVLCSFITPTRAMRALAKEIVGAADFLEVYVDCSFDECAKRDVKGLYAKVEAGAVADFTGKDSLFELPESADLVLRTKIETFAESLNRLEAAVRPRIQLS